MISARAYLMLSQNSCLRDRNNLKLKHIQARIKQCLAIAECSNCPRAKFGCLALNPETNVLLADSYNGGPRGGTALCGQDLCFRDQLNIKSGTDVQIGCVHAEMGLICNAARHGISLDKALVFINGEPCLMCAKLLHHAGISQVIVIKGVYTTREGVDYLKQHMVNVQHLMGDYLSEY